MKKVDGVTDVHVSLEAAFTQVDLRPGNTVTLDELRTIIRRSGFRPEEARITAIGVLREHKGQLMIDLAPAKGELTLAEGSAAALKDAREWLKAGGTVNVQVDGVVRKDALAVERITRMK